MTRRLFCLFASIAFVVGLCPLVALAAEATLQPAELQTFNDPPGDGGQEGQGDPIDYSHSFESTFISFSSPVDLLTLPSDMQVSVTWYDPSGSVQDRDLVQNQDYTFEVIDDQGKTVSDFGTTEGTYWVRIIGMGDFEGSTKTSASSFDVLDLHDLALAQPSYSGSNVVAYTGKPVFFNVDALYINSNTYYAWLNCGEHFKFARYTDLAGVETQPINPGSYYAVFEGIDPYHGEYKAPFIVSDPKNLAYANVDLPQGWQPYKGEPLGTSVMVTVNAEGGLVPLVKGDDYVLNYVKRGEPVGEGEYAPDGEPTEAINGPGTYGIIIKPAPGSKYMGEYRTTRDSGDVTVYSEKDLLYARTYIKGDHPYGLFASDKVMASDLVVTVAGETLTLNKDYTVTWQDVNDESSSVSFPLGVGDYEVNLEAIAGSGYFGEYKTWISVQEYDLSSAQVTITNFDEEQPDPAGFTIPFFIGTGEDPIKAEAVVTLAGKTLKEHEDYELVYGIPDGKDPSMPWVTRYTWSDVAPSAAIDISSSGWDWYKIGARPAEGSSFTKRCENGSLFVIVDDYPSMKYAQSFGSSNMYTGFPVHPTLKVCLMRGRGLVEGRDYEIVGYKANTSESEWEKTFEPVEGLPVEKGEYKATIRGIGDIPGEKDIDFTINDAGETPFSLAKAVCTPVPYTGEPVPPNVKVTMGGEELEEGVDYDIVSITDYDGDEITPVNINSYTVTLRGRANRGCAGELQTWHRVVSPNDLSNASVTGLEPSYAYTGQAIEIKPVVTAPGSSKPLVEGVDYEVEFWPLNATSPVKQCIEPGEYSMNILGIGDYCGICGQLASGESTQFVISEPEFDLTKATITGIEPTYTYTGEQIPFSYDVSINGKKLLEGRDFTSFLHYRRGNANGYTTGVFHPGIYTLILTPVAGTPYLGRKVVTFEVLMPETVDESTGVAVAGEALVDFAGNGNTVAMQTGDVSATGSQDARGKCAAYEAGEADYAGIVDVKLNVVDSDDNVVRRLTERFGDLALSFPVDEGLNGKAARVIQYHVDSNGETREIKYPVGRVVDGAVSVEGVNLLSEFVVIAGDAALDDLDAIDVPDVDPLAAVRAELKAEAAKAALLQKNTKSSKDGTDVDPTSKWTTPQEHLKLVEVIDPIDADNDPDPAATLAKLKAAVKVFEDTLKPGTKPAIKPTETIDISKATIAKIADQTYTTKAIEPKLTVTLDEKELVEGTDFTVSYKDNIEVGKKATATITGKGAYEGEATATFEITSPAKAAMASMPDLDPNAWYMGGDGTRGGYFPDTDTLYLDYALARGLMSGFKDENGKVVSFGPAKPLSRAQSATILYRMANDDISPTTDPAKYERNKTGLSDVADNQYYTAAVNWAYKNGVMTGYTDDAGKPVAFGPDDSINREQIATTIGRWCMSDAGGKMPKPTKKASDLYDDAQAISDWAQEGAAFCNENGIMTGVGGTKNFDPKANAERCQMAKIIAVTDRIQK